MSFATLLIVLLLEHAFLGQALLFEETCRGRCGTSVDHSASCQCNSQCHKYGDCCTDYDSVCTDAGSAASCAGQCNNGYDSHRQCQCNSQCVSHGNCCQDYATLCHGSCAWRCDSDYNSQDSCHCNSQCTSHNNCCHDYASLCQGHPQPTQGQGHVTSTACSADVNDVSEALWSKDVNRLESSKYTLNFQARVPYNNTIDHAAAPFFTHVDASALTSRPTYSAFLALQDNYNPVGGQREATSASEDGEVGAFLDAVLATPVMTALLQYLRCRNIVTDQAHLRSTLNSMWFSPYSRHHGGPVDSSGFEHVMVGEFKSSTQVNGLHSWLAFYDKERSHLINYYGYVRQKSPDLVAVAYEWGGRVKAVGGFFVGTSPEFDMALFTLCALTSCTSLSLNGHTVPIQIYLSTHTVNGVGQVLSAYPEV